ncbi:glycoside hydrolase family 79 protein [Xylariaceae sp. FL0804]|nr:glycoside hydrolase family 79 protein [Xylariaceae sp. FL0804]
MAASMLILALAGAAMARGTLYTVSPIAEAINTSQPLEGFVSFSIEFSSFPDFAGNSSYPNELSNNLLDNIGYLTGTKPYIRVGGNTQDYAIYNPNLTVALNGTFNVSRSADYPTTIEIGPSLFDSYSTWPYAKYSFGFNMGGNHDPRQWETVLQTAALACKALEQDRLYLWEYGNEADLYSTSSQGPVRPPDWNETAYVAEWLNGTRQIKSVIEQNCPDLAGNDSYGYLAPSFGGTGNTLRAPVAWADGLDQDEDIRYFTSHNYISGADTPGVTLQATLLNHTSTSLSVNAHIAEYNSINPGVPHIFGEANSLYNEGRPGLSNTFGAALWVVDFNLYCAASGIGRVHMHMGTDYRYAAWQPITTNKTAIGTKAPYYGSIAVAAFLGNLLIEPVRVAELTLPGGSDAESAYAAYVDGALARIAVVNMHSYNYTLNGTGPGLNPEPRPVRTYSFDVGLPANTTAAVRRLVATGSDAVSGIAWDGVSYDYALAGGRPARLANSTAAGEERAAVGADGVVDVGVPDSQVVVLDFTAV